MTFPVPTFIKDDESERKKSALGSRAFEIKEINVLCRSELGDIAKKILMFSTLLMQCYIYLGIYLERVISFQSEEPNSHCSLNMSKKQTKLLFKNNQGMFSTPFYFQ